MGEGGGFHEGWDVAGLGRAACTQTTGLQAVAPVQRPKVVAGVERNSRIGRFMQRANSELIWHQFKVKNVELFGVGSMGARLIQQFFFHSDNPAMNENKESGLWVLLCPA